MASQDCSPISDIWIDEICQLIGELSGEEWDVYDKGRHGRLLGYLPSLGNQSKGRRLSKGVRLAYLPESIKSTDWIDHTNEVCIIHHARYDSDFDVDPEGDNQNEPKYIVTGTFVDPIVTRSVSRVVEHVERQMERVAIATEFNAEIERLTFPNYVTQEETLQQDISEYSGQNCPVKSVDGVGPTSTERLARRFGTYYNVTRDGHPAIRPCLSDFHQTPMSAVIEAAGEAVDRYNELRKREEWGRIDVEPDTWVDYPKADPR